MSSSSSRRDQALLLHYKLGHPSFPYLQLLFPSSFQQGDVFSYEVCQLVKHKHLSFPFQPYLASKPFALVHSDLWVPSQVTTSSNKNWFLSFIDDHSRVCWVYLLRDKSEVENIFVQFYSMIETQCQPKI